jgi:hypothetical protein
MKPYQNKIWLRKRYIYDRKTVEQIAAECNVSHVTIVNWLRKHGISK